MFHLRRKNFCFFGWAPAKAPGDKKWFGGGWANLIVRHKNRRHRHLDGPSHKAVSGRAGAPISSGKHAPTCRRGDYQSPAITAHNGRASRTMRCETPFGAPLSIIKARLRCKGLIPFRRFLKEPKTHRSDLFEKGFNWQTGNNQPALNLHPEKAPGAKKPARCAPVRPPEGFIPPPSAASGGCLLTS